MNMQWLQKKLSGIVPIVRPMRQIVVEDIENHVNLGFENKLYVAFRSLFLVPSDLGPLEHDEYVTKTKESMLFITDLLYLDKNNTINEMTEQLLNGKSHFNKRFYVDNKLYDELLYKELNLYLNKRFHSLTKLAMDIRTSEELIPIVSGVFSSTITSLSTAKSVTGLTAIKVFMESLYKYIPELKLAMESAVYGYGAE